MDAHKQHQGDSAGHDALKHDEPVELRGSGEAKADAKPEPAPSISNDPAETIAAPVSTSTGEIPAPVVSDTPVAAAAPAPEQSQSQGFYHADGDDGGFAGNDMNAGVPTGLATAPSAPIEAEYSWSSAEYVAHHKSASWFIGLVVITLLFMAIIFFLTKDMVTIVIIAFCAVLFGVQAARKPREQSYSITSAGIQIGQKFYPYSSFQAFTLMEEGTSASIDFMPVKRFVPAISIYVDPKHENQILDILTRYLPLQGVRKTYIDSLMHKVRF